MKKQILIRLFIAVAVLLSPCLWGRSGIVRAEGISAQDQQRMIRETLDKLIDAYGNKRVGAFMDLVDENFTGDKAILGTAIRKDFSVYHDIQLSYVLDAVIPDSTGKFMVSIQYNRSMVSVRTGNVSTDHGATELVFSTGDTGPLLYSMRNPLIFGISDANNVGQGRVLPVRGRK